MKLLGVIAGGKAVDLGRTDEPDVVERLRCLWDAQPRNDADRGLAPMMCYLKHCLKRGRLDECRRLALECEPVSAEDFNILGLAHEATGNVALARVLYQHALGLDRTLGAAEFNLRRCVDIEQLGTSDIPFCV